MKAGDKIYVEQCPRDNGSCDYSGEFERVADGSYWFACPKCGWEITDEDEPLKPEEKMNRIIKFRGKRLDNGEWVYGYVVFYKNIGAQIHRDEDIEVWVDPNSVCQFTGLTDKNGKEIFEGDIITDDENFGLVIFNLGFDIEFYGKSGSFTEGGWNEDAGSYGIIETTELNEQVSEWATVLGNIHDDPELIKTK